MRSPALVLTALVAVAATTVAFTHPTISPAAGTTEVQVAASPASGFSDAVGVNVHLGMPGTPYADFTRVESLLVGMGVHHIRTALPRSPSRQFYTEVKALAARGITTDLILGSAGALKGGSAILTPVAAELDRIDSNGLAPALDAIEGPNEWDSRGGPTWATEDREYQIELYRSVKADPVLRSIPVIGPSVANIDHAAQLGDLSAYLDYGNVHAYPQGGQPLTRLPSNLAAAHTVSGDKPVMATETGYQTAVNGSGLQPPVSPTTQAVYTSWLYPGFAADHVTRTYVYELLDGAVDPTRSVEEANYGIVTAVGAAKPAYTAVQNLMALVDAPAPGSGVASSGPAGLTLHVSTGSDAPSHMVLDRADGSYLVLLWTPVTVPSKLGSVHDLPTTGSTNVQIGAPGYVATTFRPALQAGALHAFAPGSTVQGSVGPDLAVVEFSRSNATGTPLVPAAHAPSVDAFSSPFQHSLAPTPAPSSSTPVVIGAVVLVAAAGVVTVVIVRRRRRHPTTGPGMP
jgi:hypothetical protein